MPPARKRKPAGATSVPGTPCSCMRVRSVARESGTSARTKPTGPLSFRRMVSARGSDGIFPASAIELGLYEGLWKRRWRLN